MGSIGTENDPWSMQGGRQAQIQKAAAWEKGVHMK